MVAGSCTCLVESEEIHGNVEGALVRTLAELLSRLHFLGVVIDAVCGSGREGNLALERSSVRL